MRFLRNRATITKSRG